MQNISNTKPNIAITILIDYDDYFNVSLQFTVADSKDIAIKKIYFALIII